jgi:uncharacterized protein YukE
MAMSTTPRGSGIVADALERLAAPAADLLDRVDAALIRHGFPPGHPIAPLLRAVGALPSDAVRAISERQPEPLRATGSVLRQHAEGYRRQRAQLLPEPGWGGHAGDRYEAERVALTDHLDAAADRLDATADYLDEVADWIERSRNEVAVALADALGSAEAVRLRVPAEGASEAAALGAHVLRAAAGTLDSGRLLVGRWAGRLDELPYAPRVVPTARPHGISVDRE